MKSSPFAGTAGEAPAIALKEEGDRRLVSVLVAALPGLAELGERLDPEVLRYFEASFLDVLGRAVRRYDGTVAKVGHTEVVAWFGAPAGHEDDPERAVLAALELLRESSDLSTELERRHALHPRPQVGIGTGEVVAGPLEPDMQATFTVIGPTVDMARVLAGAAPAGQLLIDELTQRLVRQAVAIEPQPALAVTGRNKPVASYRVLDRRSERLARAASPFVGRTGEMGYLVGALEHVQQQARGLSLAVIGEAGVGKSRLMREFRAQAAAGVLQLDVRCASFEAETPYALLAHLVRRAFGIEPGMLAGSTGVALERGFAALQLTLTEPELLLLLRLLGHGDSFPYSPEARRAILVRLLRQVTRQQTAEGPVLIVAEDLHWADAASLAVLAELARDLPMRACLLLVTARPPWRATWPAEKLELVPLPEKAARTLAVHLLGATDQAVLEQVLAQAGGNPFFLEEVAQSSAAAGVGQRLAGQAALVPPSIHGVLQARLDHLPDATRPVVRLAAVCGRTVRAEVLEHLLPGEWLAGALAVLEREQLLMPSTSGERGYTFRHALIQEVAYGAQLRAHRRRMHAAVGAALESRYPQRLDELFGELAFHYGRSDNDQKALEWLIRAANRAKALYANEDSLDLYRAALMRAPDGDGPLEGGGILEQIGDVQALVGRYDEAIVSFRTAQQRMPQASGPTAARLHRRIGVALLRKGAYQDAATALELGLAVLGSAQDSEAAQIHTRLGQLYFLRSDYPAAREALTAAMTMASNPGGESVVAECLKLLGQVSMQLGDPTAAAELFLHSRHMYERLEDPAGIANARSDLGIFYRRSGQWDEALAEFHGALVLRERIGDHWGVAGCHNNIGELHRSRGDFGEAVKSYERALELWESSGSEAQAASTMIGRAAARIGLGDVLAGRAELLAAERRLGGVGSTFLAPDLYRYLAVAELATGDLHAATRAAQRSLELARAANARQQEAMTQRVFAEIVLAGGEIEVARKLRDASKSSLCNLGASGELAQTEALLGPVLQQMAVRR